MGKSKQGQLLVTQQLVKRINAQGIERVATVTPLAVTHL